MAYSPALRHIDAILRISLGWIFLWAFLDKLFGFGLGTAPEKAWLAGGSPTSGFLANSPTGPFANAFNALAGVAWVDWLFMLGLALIGFALILGVGMRIATTAGSLLLLLMWLAVLPPKNNPFLDDHLIYLLVLQALQRTRSEQAWSLNQRWSSLQLVKKHPWLA